MINPYNIEVKESYTDGVKVMIARIPGTPHGFIWHGGAYIDSIRQSVNGTFEADGSPWIYGEECINVWDYEADEPEIKFTDKDGLIRVITEWMDA